MATFEKRVPTPDGWQTVPKSEWRKRQPGAKWRVKIRRRGHPMKSAIFERKKDADAWAAKIEAAIHEGRYFDNIEATKRTLSDLIDRYETDVIPHKRDKRQLNQLKWFKRRYGHLLLKDFTAPVIAEARDKLGRPDPKTGKVRSPATVNRYLAALSHACSVAWREWLWLESNPVFQVRKRKEPRGRVRYLSDEERERLLKAAQESSAEYVYPVVMLALSSGMRRGEVLGLRWEDVDLEGRLITLHDTKNGERRGVPLVSTVRDLLVEWKAGQDDGEAMVFPRTQNFHRPWSDVVQAAELANFRFHDLRHTTASYLAMQGVALNVIGDILGHKTPAMTKRYAHLSREHLRGVLEELDGSIHGGEP